MGNRTAEQVADAAAADQAAADQAAADQAAADQAALDKLNADAAAIAELQASLAPLQARHDEITIELGARDAALETAHATIADLERRVAEALALPGGPEVPPAIADCLAAGGFITFSDGSAPITGIPPMQVAAYQFADAGDGKVTYVEPIGLSGVGLEATIVIGTVDIRNSDGDIVRSCQVPGNLALRPGTNVSFPARSLIF